jgi:hypothetical protein
MLFPQIYMRVKNIVQKDTVIKISGKISVREGETAIILADDISLLAAKGNGSTEDYTSAVASKLYLKFNTRDETLRGEIENILRAYSGTIPVTVRCSATMEALNMKYKVRDCQAIRFELEAAIGADNYLFR